MGSVTIDINIDNDIDVKNKPTPSRKNSGYKSNKYDDPLKRRLFKGGINFYDLGQLKSGDTWIDIPFEVITSVSVAGSIAIASPLSAGDFETLRALIFSVDPSEWTTQYRKLEYEEAERYGLDVVDVASSTIYPVARNGSRLDYLGAPVVDTKWTQKGLALTSSLSSFKMKSYGAFNSFTNAASEYKVTLEPDASSDAVTFDSLSKDATVFLVPRIANFFGLSESDILAGHNEMLYAKYRALQRSWWLDRVDETYVYPLLSFNESGISLDNQASLLSMAQEDATEYSSDGSTAILGSAGSFPMFSPFASGNAFYLDHEQINFLHLHSPSAGKNTVNAFAGAVKQGGQTYYFWAKSLSFGDNSNREIGISELWGL